VVIQVEEAGTIRIDLVDALGRLVKEGLLEEALPLGRHARRVSLEGVAPGVYFLRATSGSEVDARRVVVLGR
jgi:hypothetical protein